MTEADVEFSGPDQLEVVDDNAEAEDIQQVNVFICSY